MGTNEPKTGTWWVLPVPPSANAYWRVWRNRAVRTKEAGAYRFHVQAKLYAMRVAPWPEHWPVAVHVKWYRAKKSGDLDNRLKVLLDALQGAAYETDAQVIELHAYRYDDRPNPRVEVLVEAV